MLGNEGVINSALGRPRASSTSRSRPCCTTGTRSIITLIYVWIPFATLPILAVLGRIDVRLHDAAADLYASPFQQFRRVTLPLSHARASPPRS